MKKEHTELFYKYLTYFLFFSFFGWIFETLIVYITSGHITDRGYFFIGPRLGNSFVSLSHSKISLFHIIWGLPAIEMYGIGGLLIVITLKKYRNNIAKIFIFGSIFMTLFELLGSYWCEYVIHHIYWNYNHESLNFHGRICLQSSVAWGILSIFVILFFEPKIKNFYKYVSKYKNHKKILIFLGVYMIVCALVKYILYPNIIPN